MTENVQKIAEDGSRGYKEMQGTREQEVQGCIRGCRKAQGCNGGTKGC